MPNLERIDALYRDATNCRACFEGAPCVEAPIIDVAQPRWTNGAQWGPMAQQLSVETDTFSIALARK